MAMRSCAPYFRGQRERLTAASSPESLAVPTQPNRLVAGPATLEGRQTFV